MAAYYGENAVWRWEEFADEEAVATHFRHDFFRARQLETADLPAEPAAARPLSPVLRRVSPAVSTESDSPAGPPPPARV